MSANTLNELSEIKSFEIKPCDVIDFNNKNFKRLDLTSSQKSNISLLVSQMPTLIAAETLSNAYTIKFPDGFPELVDTLMHYKDGGIGPAIIGEDGKIMKHASFHPVDSQAALLQAFSVMSLATGQYFLAEINGQLTMINQKIDKIMDFLYGDKKAELMSEISFVQYAYKNFNSIMSHESQRTATISNLQSSKKIAMKDIEFYLSDLNAKVNSPAKSYSEFKTLAGEAFQIKDSLELSIQLYVMSSLMEVHYAQNTDLDYIQSLREDITYYITKCDRRILSDFSKLSARNNELGKPMLIGKKADVSALDKQIEKVIDSFNGGENSQTYVAINSALDAILNTSEYHLDKDGNVYLKTA